MFKKLSFAILIALIAVVPLAGLAAAQEGPPPPNAEGDLPRRPRLGQVTAIGSDNFSIQLLNGETLTVQVDDETAYRFQEDGSTASFSDLKVGRWVAGGGRQMEDGTTLARLVVILPEDFDPEDLKPIQLRGEVGKINSGQDTFTIITVDGEEITLSVDENTRYAGTIAELKDLERGMQIGAAAIKQESGDMLAKVVANARPDGGQPGQRATGVVAAAGSSSLTITTRDGNMTFSVNDETLFRSQDGEISGLDDLEVDQVVIVIYQDLEGDLVAKAVLVGEGAMVRFEKAPGTVQSAGGSRLTIEIRSGEKLSFTVDENTRFGSRDGSLEDLNDLKNGDPVLVVYEIQEDGTLLAKGVLARIDDPDGNQAPEEKPSTIPPNI